MQLVGADLKQFEKNLFIQKCQSLGVKEQLFSDTVAAVGFLRSQITKCAYPNFVGRKIITTASTNEAVERFPLDNKSVAYSYAEGSATRLSGRKNQVVTIKMDKYAECAEQWTREFIEDATQKAVDNIVEKTGKALGEDETKTVIDLYGSIEEEDLAGGEILDQNNHVMDWTAVLKLHNAVRLENWRPNVLLLNEEQLGQLLLDNKFIEYEYLPASEVDLESPGLIRKIVGMKVESSTLVPNGTAYAIDTRNAGIMLIRRDVTLEDYSDPMANKYGIKASTRFGLGILRSTAVAKMVNIKTSI